MWRVVELMGAGRLRKLLRCYVWQRTDNLPRVRSDPGVPHLARWGLLSWPNSCDLNEVKDLNDPRELAADGPYSLFCRSRARICIRGILWRDSLAPSTAVASFPELGGRRAVSTHRSSDTRGRFISSRHLGDRIWRPRPALASWAGSARRPSAFGMERSWIQHLAVLWCRAGSLGYRDSPHPCGGV